VIGEITWRRKAVVSITALVGDIVHRVGNTNAVRQITKCRGAVAVVQARSMINCRQAVEKSRDIVHLAYTRSAVRWSHTDVVLRVDGVCVTKIKYTRAWCAVRIIAAHIFGGIDEINRMGETDTVRWRAAIWLAITVVGAKVVGNIHRVRLAVQAIAGSRRTITVVDTEILCGISVNNVGNTVVVHAASRSAVSIHVAEVRRAVDSMRYASMISFVACHGGAILGDVASTQSHGGWNALALIATFVGATVPVLNTSGSNGCAFRWHRTAFRQATTE
jgi:hypothetical protein